MRINLTQISRFSKCPRYFHYLENSLTIPISKSLTIASLVIKKAYNIALESGHLVDYRRIVGWVDTEVFRNVDVGNKESFKAARSLSEYILNFIQIWRESIYVIDKIGGYSDLTLNISIGNRHFIEGKIPIILPLDIPVITYIDNIDLTDTKMYNDIKARGLAWMVSKFLSVDKITLRHLQMKPRGGFNVNEIHLNKKKNDATGELLSQLVESINCDINYPSITEQCLTCAFRKRCKF